MLLNGKELAGFIKERQAGQVRSLRHKKIFPKLAVVMMGGNQASEKYVAAKKKYAKDIGIEIEVIVPHRDKLESTVKALNIEPSVHGIIIQLPLPKNFGTDAAINLISPEKDVDGLGAKTKFSAATPTAILWLLAAYQINPKAQPVAIIGNGRLVGAPLAKILKSSKVKVTIFDEFSTGIEKKLKNYSLIITAVGKPGLIKSSMVSASTVIIDAGTAESSGKLSGDVDPSIYERDDIKISPVPGGVGPLTVAALFENVIGAASS